MCRDWMTKKQKKLSTWDFATFPHSLCSSFFLSDSLLQFLFINFLFLFFYFLSEQKICIEVILAGGVLFFFLSDVQKLIFRNIDLDPEVLGDDK